MYRVCSNDDPSLTVDFLVCIYQDNLLSVNWLLIGWLVFLQDCSIFYSKRFCLPCVMDSLEEFPTEIQQVN